MQNSQLKSLFFVKQQFLFKVEPSLFCLWLEGNFGVSGNQSQKTKDKNYFYLWIYSSFLKSVQFLNEIFWKVKKEML